MNPSPFRRIALVVLIYVAVGWVVLGAGGWLRRVLALPQLFQTLLALGLMVGLPVAAILAWKYPDLGPDARGSNEGPVGDGRSEGSVGHGRRGES